MYLKFRTITNHTTSQGNCHKFLEVFGNRLVGGDNRPYVGGPHGGPADFLLLPVAEVLGDKGQKVLARDPDRGEERCSVRCSTNSVSTWTEDIDGSTIKALSSSNFWAGVRALSYFCSNPGFKPASHWRMIKGKDKGSSQIQSYQLILKKWPGCAMRLHKTSRWRFRSATIFATDLTSLIWGCQSNF